MKRQMFNFLLLQVLFIPWFQWRAMNTASIWIVTTQFWITFALQTTISFRKYNINLIFLNVCFIGRSWLCWLEWRRKWWNRATWTACTGLLTECFDNLLKWHRNSMITLFFAKIVFISNLPMKIQLKVVSKKSYRHAWVCSHQLFAIGSMPIHSCNYVHHTQQNWNYPTEMHHELIRRALEPSQLGVPQYVSYLQDFEHEVAVAKEWLWKLIRIFL